MAKREVDVTGGTKGLDTVLRELFTALSGRRAPIEKTSSNEADLDRTVEYRTAEGDGLTETECLDYGEYHHRWTYTITVDAITASVFEIPREPLTFYVSAPDDRIDHVTATLIQLATAGGYTVVAQRTG